MASALDDVWSRPFEEALAPPPPPPTMSTATAATVAPSASSSSPPPPPSPPTTAVEHAEMTQLMRTLLLEMQSLREERGRQLRVGAGIVALAVAIMIGYLDRIYTQIRLHRMMMAVGGNAQWYP